MNAQMDYFKSLMKEQQYPSDYGGEDFWENDGWLLTVSWNPTQTKLEEIAYTLLKEELQKKDEDNFHEVRFKHWACGYVLQINVKPIFFDEINLHETLTTAGEIIYEYIQDNGQDYLHLASEDDRYYEWERDMIAMQIDNDDLNTEQMDKLVTHLIHECDVYVESDGTVYDGTVWSNDGINKLIEEETDYLFGNSLRAQQRRAGEHPNQTKLFTTQEE